MIGSGIFLLPASLAFYGSISLFGWIISACGALLIARVFATLSKHIPKRGGPYVYAKEGFGDFVGFLVAWGYWISILTTNAAITVAMLGYLTVFFPIIGTSPSIAIIIGLSAIWGLSWINSRGIKTAGQIQVITTILKVAPLLVIAVFGIFYIDWTNFSPLNVSGESDLKAIIATTTLTLFAFLGIESGSIPADDIEDPAKTIGKATMRGTYIAILVYVLGSMVVMGVIPSSILQYSDAPFADVAMQMWGPWAKYLVAAGAVIATFGALNGWILMQGQIPMAAARDKMFYAPFAEENRMGSPAIGIAISSVIVSAIMLLNFNKGFVKAFEFMILLSTLTCLVPYLFSTATHMLFSLQKRISSNWLIGLVAFLFSCGAIIGSGSDVVFWGFMCLIAGIPVYVWIRKTP